MKPHVVAMDALEDIIILFHREFARSLMAQCGRQCWTDGTFNLGAAKYQLTILLVCVDGIPMPAGMMLHHSKTSRPESSGVLLFGLVLFFKSNP